MFDQAILSFGNYIEAKCAERDKDGKPVYTLEQLLTDGKGKKVQSGNDAFRDFLKAMGGRI